MTETVEQALGYSITSNLGDDRQIVLQCFVGEDTPITEIHRRVDKAMAVADRQKAKYSKIELLKDLDKMEKTLRNLKNDMVEAEKNFERSQIEFDQKLSDCLKSGSDIMADAVESGRTSPVGANAQRHKALNSEMHRLNAEKQKSVEERKVIREQMAQGIIRYEEEIAIRRNQIAECDVLIGG